MMEDRESIRVVKLLLVFGVAFSLAGLPGQLSSFPQLPIIHATNASVSPNQPWYPAGPAMNTEQVNIFSDQTSELNALCAGTIDLTDSALPSPLPIQLPPTCPNVAVTSPVSTHDIFDVQIMLHNNYWGVRMNFGQDPSCIITSSIGAGVDDTTCPGVSIRQAIAHLIDKNSFVANAPTIAGQAVPVDNDVPPSDGLVTADPCGWDRLFPQTGANCVVGSPGGTAYHLSSTTGVGHDTGGVAATYPWEPADDNGGKADLCAAAQHLVTAGVATGFNATSCVLTGISSNAFSHPVNIYARSDRPARLALGDGLAEDLCYLFTGHFPVNGVASPLCQQISTTTTACTGACLVTETRGPFCCFPGFATSNTGINDNWWLYTGGFLNVFPFDSLLFGQFNSQFVSGIGKLDQPPCSSLAVPTIGAVNYQYSCVPAYDSISNQLESAPCLSASGDPAPGQTRATVSFADCSGTSKLTEISAGYQTEDLYSKLELFVPIFSPTIQYAYQANWSRIINANGVGIPNYFTWLDAYSATPAIPGTVRQGFSSPTKSLNPLAASTFFDFNVIGNIYDSLLTSNPANPLQLIDWMTSGHSTLCSPSIGLACNTSTLGYSPHTGTAATVRFTLKPDNFWQSDGTSGHPARQVTAWDVKFSYLTCCPSSIQIPPFSPLLDVHVLDRTNFDLNLNALGPFTLSSVTSQMIFPGRYWSTSCSGATWDNDVNAGSVPDSCMAVSSAMSTITFDPLSSTPDNGQSPGILIGSGPFACQSSSGVVGSGCSSTGTENPPAGGSYTLTRFGCNRASRTCNAPGTDPTTTYFRSSGNLALYIWSGNTGDPTHDLTNISTVAFCLNKPLGTVGCTHWQKGIGAAGGSAIIDIVQVSEVAKFFGINWTGPFAWTELTGIGAFPPVLYEGTATLNPCSIDPANGYDC